MEQFESTGYAPFHRRGFSFLRDWLHAHRRGDAGRYPAGVRRLNLLAAWRRALGVLGAAALAACAPATAAESTFNAPVPARVAKEAPGLKTAIFAGGCFWGVEAVFSHTKGVKSAVSGYEGGKLARPSYQQVSSGSTGHRESVKVVYDPKVVRYDQLLQVFFSVVADPTLRNNQGPDFGTQYNAALIPTNVEQRAVATAYLRQMQASGVWKKPIVTTVEAYGPFYPAEAYHQDFALKNPTHPYIRAWDAPKVAALKAMFPALYTATYQPG